MYWTDWGYHAKIERADMSGQQRVVIVNSSLAWPNGLTLDQERDRLYWVDGSYNKLEYLHLSTNTRVTLIDSSATLPHPFGLTLLGDYLYWTDWSDYTVKRANKESATDVTVFVTGIGQPMDIHGYNLSDKTIPGERAIFVIRRHTFRWLDRIFLGGGYLPSLSINYIAVSKDMEKRLPQLHYLKMRISYDLGFIAIGVAMAT